MRERWDSFRIGDVADVYDGPHATPTKTQAGPWFLSISSLANGRLDLSQSAHLSNVDFVKWTRRVRPLVGDTLFSYETRLGECAYWSLDCDAALGRRMGLLRPKPGVDPRFLAYAYMGPQFQGEIRKRAIHGATVDRIPIADLPNWEILLPPLAEQRRIAGVLGALDDLIEVNRGLISDLLATVNADFERRFGQRELSLRLDALASITDCLHSKKPDRVTSGHRLLQLSNILDSGQLDIDDIYGITAEDYLRWSKNIETREWDCVITNVGRVGAVARIPAGVAAALGRNMTAIRPKAPEHDGAFILAALLSRPVRREITLKTDSGTVMDALNVKNIPSLRLPEASPGERSEFHAFARPLLLAADALKIEVTQIKATRDELLPLLMSGRVRVAEGEAA